MILELTDDEARAVAETLRRTIESAERGATRDHNLVHEQQHLARVARVLGVVLDKIERLELRGPATSPVDPPALYWIMLGPGGDTAVLVHRKNERDGLRELGYTIADSARLDTREQAMGWFKAYSAKHLRVPASGAA